MHPHAWERPLFRVAKINAKELPPSHGSIWLDGDDIWLSTRSVEFTVDGRLYEIPGGSMCFPKEKAGREALLKTLRAQRDLWEPSDEAALKARLIQWAQKSKG